MLLKLRIGIEILEINRNNYIQEIPMVCKSEFVRWEWKKKIKMQFFSSTEWV